MQRLVTTDDHSGTEIMDQIETTQASVSVSRNGQGVVWPGLNLTDESWEGLIKLIRDYLPDVAAIVSRAGEGDGQAVSQPAAEPSVSVPSPRSAPTGELTGKDYSRAVRAWWYALNDEAIKALGLKVPNRTVNFGKMPQAVYDAYESAH